MASMSVNRCIAVAAHGRRCQQTTYRGGPYCWHHTQSRKVWAPSRVSSRRQQRPKVPTGRRRWPRSWSAAWGRS
jgi:hypothetical protein